MEEVKDITWYRHMTAAINKELAEKAKLGPLRLLTDNVYRSTGVTAVFKVVDKLSGPMNKLVEKMGPTIYVTWIGFRYNSNLDKKIQDFVIDHIRKMKRLPLPGHQIELESGWQFLITEVAWGDNVFPHRINYLITCPAIHYSKQTAFFNENFTSTK